MQHTDLELDERIQVAKNLNQAISGALEKEQQNAARLAGMADGADAMIAAEQELILRQIQGAGDSSSSPENTGTFGCTQYVPQLQWS